MVSLRRITTAGLAALVGIAVVVTIPTSAGAAFATHSAFDPTARPLGAVTVIGDSVLDGSMITSPTIATRLAEQGWGPIRAQTRGGYSTGGSGIGTPEYWASYWIGRWRSQGWDAPNVLVNLGANDSGWCYSADCAYRSVMHLVDAIGPGHTIWWPKITRFPYYRAQQDGWNAALDRVAAERDDFHTWDWPTVMANGPFPSSDYTHLSGDGYRLRSLLMAQQFTADVARARHTGDDAPLPSAIGDPAEYVALLPDRVVDTRDERDTPLPAGEVLEVDMTGFVPAGATAVAVNLASTESTGPGYLSAYPCDRTPRTVSSVNYEAGRSRGALAIVPLSDDGHLCVLTKAAGHVVVDIQGAFVPSDGTKLSLLPQQERLLDTRETGRETVYEIGVPDAAAVAINLTATGATRNGWLRAYPCGDQPKVANLNFGPDESVASAAIVPVSADGTICVTSLVPVDVVVDIVGTFDETGDLRFQAADPTRTLDVRDGTGGWSPILGGGQTIDARVAPADAVAVTGTIAQIRPVRRGWARADDCGTSPPTASVNAGAGVVMANSVTTGIAEGRMCITSNVAGAVSFDTTGWWVP